MIETELKNDKYFALFCLLQFLKTVIKNKNERRRKRKNGRGGKVNGEWKEVEG